MRTPCLITVLLLLTSLIFAQPQAKPPQFDVASVKPSQQTVGPDYNNQVTFTHNGLSAKNVTLKRLIAEAWNIQINQVLGPRWIEQNEYNIEARATEGTSKDQKALMLRTLLAERFKLKEHTDSREMQVYDLVVAKTGPKIHPLTDETQVKPTPGFHFHGDMHRFADLLAIQFSMPAVEDPSVPSKAGGAPILIIDKTGLEGTFDFGVDIHPEPNTDMLTVWQRILKDQLGLRTESRKDIVPVVVVQGAEKIPTEY